MRTTYFFIVIFLVTMTACTKKDRDCFTDSYSYTLLTNSMIDTITIQNTIFTAVIKEGEKQVFRYRQMHTCSEMADAGWGKELIFQVPQNSSSFKYVQQDFSTIRCYCHSFPEFGPVQQSQQPLSGSIEGKKVNNNTWQVTINVQVTSNERINITKQFSAN